MSDTEERDHNDEEKQEAKEVNEEEGIHDTKATTGEEKRSDAKKAGEESKQTNGHTDKRDKGSSKPTSSRASTRLDKKTQQMVAELNRLKTQMVEFQQSIHRPPVRPFTPDIFNSLSPYYNRYMVNSTIQDLQQEEITHVRGYGHRPTALGVVDPEISWKLDNFPNPVPHSRLPGRLFQSAEWSRNLSRSSNEHGSTRLPPLPMPNFPKFNQSHYQPHKMTYDQLANFRTDLTNTYEALAEKQAKADYDRTVKDWNRMNLSELKKLPPSPRYHIKKAIVSYLGTSRGSSEALKPLTKQLDASTPTPISQS
ncbi:hypothetical protein ACROYT_G032074 [Oculina patagonica]